MSGILAGEVPSICILVIELYANTSITKDFLDGIADREYYMFPEEAKELGIVDTIVGVDCPIDEIL